ncbi:DUF4249 domain-containing protein [Prolixibacteraceae bacterium Z1-6]|uniref:DUF4249 domain-containing protein n=1 Tax=Draconibacterium aestuarii TaxID=2998507 RepID=A0A9X3FCR7_9BACT|nr:DUF4249 domain-containing protein [Prolixibacteraceae bacterium Z1-6]
MVQKNHINCLLTLLVGVILFACEEPFNPNIDIKDYESMLVVEGIITDQTGPFSVRLSSSVPLDTSISEIPVNGADVVISDDNGNTYRLYSGGNGWYSTINTNLKAEVGVSYMLNITTADGQQYESGIVTLEKGPEIEKVHFQESTRTNFAYSPPKEETWLDVFVNTKGEDDKTSYVKWGFEETWEVRIPDEIKVADAMGNIHDDVVRPNEELRHCWVSNSSNLIHVATTEKQEVNEILDYPIKSFAPREDMLNIKYSMLVTQYSMSKEMYNFWKKLKDNNESLGSMFDKMPGAVYGNIQCCNENKKALGYFMASEVKQKRIFIDRTDHHLKTISGYQDCLYTYAPMSPSFIYFGQSMETRASIYNSAQRCIDCLNVGTNTKPSFWE